MEMKVGLSVAILEVLDKDNYVTWSVWVKTYLMAKDLWDIVEAIIEPPMQEDDEAAFNTWCEKNSMALNVIQVSCGPDALSIIRQISSAKIAWNTLTVFCQVLKKDNYVEWSVRVKTYLMALDLWEIIEAATEPLRREDDEATFKAWSKKNSTALHIIQISCSSDIFSEIIEISSAKIAWDTLAKKFLEEDNYMDWSDRVKTYLMAHHLWETVEATTKPPMQEDDDAAFKALSKKNSMALHIIQISCSSEAFSEIIEISSAKIAWDTLAKKYNSGINYVQYETLKKAVQSGDWIAVDEFLKRQPEATASKITNFGETTLHLAVEAGHEDIVEKLVDLMSEEDLAIPNIVGTTALAYAINAGSYRMAACMLRKNNNLLCIRNAIKEIPVNHAIIKGHIELARYLYSLTPFEDLMPEKGVDGATFCTEAIYNRSLNIALDLIQRCPHLALALDKWGSSPLYALADMPNAFSRGDGLVFWKRWIYNYCVHVEPANVIKEIRLDILNLEKSQSDKVKIIKSVKALLCQLVSNLHNFLGIKDLYEMKLANVQSHELLDHMCKEVSISQRKGLIDKAIFRSIVRGNFEFIFRIVKANSNLMWSHPEDSMSIFAFAILHRQPKIFSLIYGLPVKKAVGTWVDKKGNIILHMTGRTEASIQLNQIQGAALQMQRELQWFKEVESIVLPRYREFLNHDGLTPRELFTKNHKALMKEGEKWMKGTATSCTVVGALIVTIMFAAAFTIPGGNTQDTGFPVFLNEKVFMLFIISDALSLFSATTSVLMFLGILTSRYAEDDFLESLPRKMIIGLSTLFFSIATMMIAFCATLLIMLQGQSWIIIPVICLASIPITLFVLMQFPLLVELFISTYGPGIFDKKMERWV